MRQPVDATSGENNGGTGGAISGAPGLRPGERGPSSAAALRGSGDLGNLLRKFAASGNAAESIENELNLSSLDRVELMSALEERYQVELSETSFAEAKTVGDVERLLREPAALSAQYVYPRWALAAPVRWLRLGRVLRAGVARYANSGAPENCRKRTFERAARTCHRRIESHYATCGHWLDSRGVARTLPAQAGYRRGRRNAATDAAAAGRLVFCETLGVSGWLPDGYRAV